MILYLPNGLLIDLFVVPGALDTAHPSSLAFLDTSPPRFSSSLTPIFYSARPDALVNPKPALRSHFHIPVSPWKPAAAKYPQTPHLPGSSPLPETLPPACRPREVWASPGRSLSTPPPQGSFSAGNQRPQSTSEDASSIFFTSRREFKILRTSCNSSQPRRVCLPSTIPSRHHHLHDVPTTRVCLQLWDHISPSWSP